MQRPTRILINADALQHNLNRVKAYAPGKGIIAMVKANAYGCGVAQVAPVLDGQVAAFGVACLDEALAIRALGCQTPCMLAQGVFSVEELQIAAELQFACVVHNHQQLQWVLNTPLQKPITVWLKVNTGMHRLGFDPLEVPKIHQALQQCAWVNKAIGLMTHFACADEPDRAENKEQLARFQSIDHSGFGMLSLANSAALIALPQTQADLVRPGIMLYGVSPFANQTGQDLQLKPVMRFVSAITTIHHYKARAAIGYSGTWSSDTASIIGIVPVGYGDGYPRRIAPDTPVWVEGQEVPIVGRVSMDMLAVDLTHHKKSITEGCPVELWGEHVPVERIAQSVGTIGYELLCQVTNRPRGLF